MKFNPFSGKVGRISAAVALAGVAGATALAVTPGTFGGFSAGTTNPGNTVSAGTVQMTNSVGDGSHLTLTGHDYAYNNLAPGHYATGSVEINNSGSLPAKVTLAIANVTFKNSSGTTLDCATDTSGLCNDYTLKIVDAESPTAATVYNTNLANTTSALSVNDSAGNATWSASTDNNTFMVTVTLNSGAGNEAQGSTASFDLGWTSTSV